MSIEVVCQACACRKRVAEQHAGRKLKCECGQVSVVPQPSADDVGLFSNLPDLEIPAPTPAGPLQVAAPQPRRTAGHGEPASLGWHAVWIGGLAATCFLAFVAVAITLLVAWGSRTVANRLQTQGNRDGGEVTAEDAGTQDQETESPAAAKTNRPGPAPANMRSVRKAVADGYVEASRSYIALTDRAYQGEILPVEGEDPSAQALQPVEFDGPLTVLQLPARTRACCYDPATQQLFVGNDHHGILIYQWDGSSLNADPSKIIKHEGPIQQLGLKRTQATTYLLVATFDSSRLSVYDTGSLEKRKEIALSPDDEMRNLVRFCTRTESDDGKVYFKLAPFPVRDGRHDSSSSATPQYPFAPRSPGVVIGRCDLETPTVELLSHSMVHSRGLGVCEDGDRLFVGPRQTYRLNLGYADHYDTEITRHGRIKVFGRAAVGTTIKHLDGEGFANQVMRKSYVRKSGGDVLRNSSRTCLPYDRVPVAVPHSPLFAYGKQVITGQYQIVQEELGYEPQAFFSEEATLIGFTTSELVIASSNHWQAFKTINLPTSIMRRMPETGYSALRRFYESLPPPDPRDREIIGANPEIKFLKVELDEPSRTALVVLENHVLIVNLDRCEIPRELSWHPPRIPESLELGREVKVAFPADTPQAEVEKVTFRGPATAEQNTLRIRPIEEDLGSRFVRVSYGTDENRNSFPVELRISRPKIQVDFDVSGIRLDPKRPLACVWGRPPLPKRTATSVPEPDLSRLNLALIDTAGHRVLATRLIKTPDAEPIHLTFADFWESGLLLVLGPQINVPEASHPFRFLLFDHQRLEPVADRILEMSLVGCEVISGRVLACRVGGRGGGTQSLLLPSLQPTGKPLTHIRDRIAGRFADGWIYNGVLFSDDMKQRRLLLEMPCGDGPKVRPSEPSFPLQDPELNEKYQRYGFTRERDWQLYSDESLMHARDEDRQKRALPRDRFARYILASNEQGMLQIRPVAFRALRREAAAPLITPNQLVGFRPDKGWWRIQHFQPHPTRRLISDPLAISETQFAAACRNYVYVINRPTRPQPVDLPLIAQTTFELSVDKPTRVDYSLPPGHNDVTLSLYRTTNAKTTGGGHNTHVTSFRSTNGQFEIDLTPCRDELMDMAITRAVAQADLHSDGEVSERRRRSSRSRRGNSELLEKVGRYAERAREGYRAATGKTTSKIPFNLFALVTARPQGGERTSWLHSYIVQFSRGDLQARIAQAAAQREAQTQPQRGLPKPSARSASRFAN